jgi:DNA-binding response OmpR family regulator
MNTSTILIIEDDSAIRAGVLDALDAAGYRTLHAGDGRRGLELALSSDWDLLLLDLMLPGLGGLDILKEVRRAHPTLPVIILTARGEEQDRVSGLRLGADDYVVKPFGVRELLARVEAVLRRSPQRPAALQEVEIPGGIVELARREVRFDDGSRGELSVIESDLLAYLARNAGRAIAREELLANVWRVSPHGVETRTVDMHVVRLREKLRDSAGEPRVIQTVRGKGYRFGSVAAHPDAEAPGDRP